MNQLESEYLLRDCRELLTARMRSSMKKMLGDVEDLLFEMATGGDAAGRAADYIDAVREIRMKKREIQVRFENRLMEQFDWVVRGSQPDFPDHDPQVIDIRHAREDVTRQQVEKLRGECRLVLAELDRHVSKLLHTTVGPAFDNPLAPRMVFDAFQDSCRDINVEGSIRQILLDRFDRHVGPVLQGVYVDLNRLFENYENGRITDSLPQPEGHGLSSRLVGNWIREKVLMQTEDLPEFVRTFVLGAWTRVLERVYERHGEPSPEWGRALQVVTDLYECTRWTGDRETRRRQIWMLPGLIYRLKTGMKTVAIPLKEQADFLSQLKTYHARISESGAVAGSNN